MSRPRRARWRRALLLTGGLSLAVVLSGVLPGSGPAGHGAARGAPAGLRLAVPGERPAGAAGRQAALRRLEAGIAWRRSRPLGRPTAGRLVAGVQLPVEGEHFVTWDTPRRTTGNRGWRRWGTDRLVRTLLRVVREHAAAHPGAPRVVVGDLSRPHGGPFGPSFGGDGHASHQNGLDVDVYYPRRDRLERAPVRPGQIDRALAQDLVDRFVRAGAQDVFVGPRTGLRGPRKVVWTWRNHDDHLHVRLRPPRRR
ncbi:MAG TPA: penicillin-insensitive murein endopeptidase [Actinomycetes bacterium]|nr:penicillin-insensitive murein endopeptidase [Actinomycetes bacterium]